MPLVLADRGQKNTIKKICGNDDAKRFLESLGFIVGEIVSIISKSDGNVIVSIKGSRIAINKEMANKIMIWCNFKFIYFYSFLINKIIYIKTII